jgi:hypothetical protein
MPDLQMNRFSWNDIQEIFAYLFHMNRECRICFDPDDPTQDLVVLHIGDLEHMYAIHGFEIVNIQWEHQNSYVRVEPHDRYVRIKTNSLPLIVAIYDKSQKKQFHDLEISLSVP